VNLRVRTQFSTDTLGLLQVEVASRTGSATLRQHRRRPGVAWPDHDFFENDPLQPGVHQRVEDPPVIFHRLPQQEEIDLDPPIVVVNPDPGKERILSWTS